MKTYVKEFCNSAGIRLDKHRHNNYAYIVIIDEVERTRAEFIIPRRALPKDIKPRDRIEIVKFERNK